ncbi:hypothetical protein Amac_106520 [Acrocarpospora macrocephala]|uniref:Uncharacterized protein n=1 Tax=Acrocarpospora macrocephala TaxID=150177 RepID=A0A5M3X7H3_9ACTN|nr:hypothetical protein Amac_106520 [Acrocarpospora macrocephala]
MRRLRDRRATPAERGPGFHRLAGGAIDPGLRRLLHALRLCQAAAIPLGDLVATRAQNTARTVLTGAPVFVDVIVIDRAGHRRPIHSHWASNGRIP